MNPPHAPVDVEEGVVRVNRYRFAVPAHRLLEVAVADCLVACIMRQ
jgi:hypothetical protein